MPNPFERNSAPAPKSNAKKFWTIGVLAAVLVGVLVFNARNNAPRHATASVMTSAAEQAAADLLPAVIVPDANPALEIAKLADDPTLRTLKGQESWIIPAEPPANPFVLSARWRGTLMKNDIPRTILPPPTESIKTTPATSAVPNANIDGLRLKGIFNDGQRSYAILNGAMLAPGAVYRGIQILEVLDDRILCQPVGQPDSARFEIILHNPKLPKNDLR